MEDFFNFTCADTSRVLALGVVKHSSHTHIECENCTVIDDPVCLVPVFLGRLWSCSLSPPNYRKVSVHLCVQASMCGFAATQCECECESASLRD